MIRRLTLILLITGAIIHVAADEVTPTADQAAVATTVAVARWENRNLLRDDDWLVDAAAEITVGTLALQPGLVALERMATSELDAEAALAPLTVDGASPGGAVGAGVLVIGSFSTSADRLDAQVRVVHSDGRTWSGRREGATAEYARILGDCARLATQAILGRGAVIETPAPAPVPLAAAAAFWRGRRALANAEPERAVAEFMRAAQREPGFVAAWRELAGALEACGRDAAALAALDQAVALDPDDPGAAAALYQLGLSCERRNPTAAINVYQRVASQYPLSRLREDFSDGAGGPKRIADLARAGIVRCATRTDDFAAARAALPAENSEDLRKVEQWSARERRATGRCPPSLAPRLLESGIPVTLELPASLDHPVVLVAPEGQAISKLRLETPSTSVPPRLKIRRWLDVESNGEVDYGELGCVWQPGATWHAEVDVAASGWNGIELVQEHFKEGVSTVSVTAQTRPRRPASLRVVTDPPTARVEIRLSDGTSIRSATPCLISDLPSGPCRVSATISGTVRFAGETGIDLAPGESGLRWRLPVDRTNGLLQAWAVCEQVPVPETGTSVVNGTRAAAARGPRSWLVVVPVAGDVWLAERDDAGKWNSGPLPSPVNTTGDESPDALVVVPGGRLVLFFKRAGALMASTSDDGRAWSIPETVFSPSGPHDHLLFLDAASAADGTILVVVLHATNVLCATARGGRGFSPLRATNFSPGIDILWHALQQGALVPGRDGFVWHLAEARGRRLAWTGDGAWSWLPGASPFPHGIDHAVLWSSGEVVGMTQDVNRTFLRNETGWTALAVTDRRGGNMFPVAMAVMAGGGADPQRLAVLLEREPSIPLVLLAGAGVVAPQAIELTLATTVSTASTTAVPAPVAAAAIAAAAAPITTAATPSVDAEAAPPLAEASGSATTAVWIASAVLIVAAGLGGLWWWWRRRTGADS